MKRIGIFGGSFNPVHIGHLRFVIEVKERLGLDRVDLVPCANPPHKPSSDLLPFDLRFQMLADACRELDGIEVNDIESHLEGPSYTHRTLEEYRRREPDARPMFILGTLDLLTLPSWHRGPELTDIASIITVPPRHHRPFADQGIRPHLLGGTRNGNRTPLLRRSDFMEIRFRHRTDLPAHPRAGNQRHAGPRPLDLRTLPRLSRAPPAWNVSSKRTGKRRRNTGAPGEFPSDKICKGVHRVLLSCFIHDF